MRLVGFAAIVAVAAFGSSVAQAQPATPSFACKTRSLIIGAAETNGLRVQCTVNGAPAGDQTLRIIGDRPQPLCEAALSNGAAACAGTLITTDQPGQVVAELLPSGVQYQVLPQTTDGQAVSPPLEYTALPPDAGQPEVDQPATDDGSN